MKISCQHKIKLSMPRLIVLKFIINEVKQKVGPVWRNGFCEKLCCKEVAIGSNNFPKYVKSMLQNAFTDEIHPQTFSVDAF